MDTNPVEYWNAQARNYDDNIFSTIDEDVTGIITQTLDRFALCEGEADSPLGRCVDLGCGAGKYLPALASRFRSVSGYDLSPKLVGLAKKEMERRGINNVTVNVRDLVQAWYRDASEEIGSYGFAVMANVLIAPVTDDERAAMLRNALRSLCPGGHLLVIVPSLESALYVNMRCEEASSDGFNGSASVLGNDVMRKLSKAEGADLLRGVVKRSGVRTKHFLEAEFELLATRSGFEVESFEKVCYSWKSELGLDSDRLVPRGLGGPPLPWDWLFLLRPATTAPRVAKQSGGEAHAQGATGDSVATPLPARGP